MKDPVISRLNRIEGQVVAITEMYKKGKSCSQIIQQVQAVRSAMAKVSGILLTKEAKLCAKDGDIGGLQKVVERTFKTL